MTESEFAAFCAYSIQEYAREKVAAGAWAAEQALERAQREYHRLLPQGLATPDNFLYSIVNARRETVGVLWFAMSDHGAGPLAFVYDIEIAPEFRRRGYGTHALVALETKAREQGLATIALHVFGHNQAARDLYEKAGFGVTDISMAKVLT